MRAAAASEPLGLVIGALLLAVPARALDPATVLTQYVLDRWSIEQGLPQNTVRCFAQTQDGYLWICSQGGLARFDGASFVQFPLGDGTVEEVRALVRRPDGGLWIGTYGQGLFLLEGGRARRRLDSSAGLPSDLIYDLHLDRDAALWIGTTAGLARLQGSRLATYRLADGLSHETIYTVHQDRHGVLWVGTLGGGLNRLAAGRFSVLRAADGLGSDLVTALLEDREGNMWVGTYGGGLSRFVAGRLQRRYTLADGLADDRVFSLLEDGDGSLWIGSYNRGLQRLRDEQFETLTAADGLPGDSIASLFEDGNGSLWLGTIDAGIARLKQGAFVTYTTREGLADSFVVAVHGDPEGNLWLGTEGGGLGRFDGQRFDALRRAAGMPSDNVTALLWEADALWAGTLDAGVVRVERGRPGARYTTADGLPGAMITSLARDRQGALWVGTLNAGLARLRDGHVTVFGKRELGAETVRALLADRYGQLWVGTLGGGLHCWSNGRLTSYRTQQGLPGDLVFTLFEDRLGALWAGTSRGLAHRHGRHFVSFGALLGTEAVLSILEDDRGFLWLGGPRGVRRVSRQALAGPLARAGESALQPAFFGRTDGMWSGQGNGRMQPPAWRSADGRLWFATNHGISVVDPSKIVARPPPPVYIEAAVVAGRELLPGELLRLPPESRDLQIRYTAVDLFSSEGIRFRYRLHGFDPHWVDAGSRRAAFYTNLPPGAYRFEVAAGLRAGPWGERAAALAVEVQPFFRETPGFFLLCAVLVSLLVAAVHRLRVHWMRAEFAAALRERQHIAREIHDSFAQGLTATAIHLEALAQELGEEGSPRGWHLDRAQAMVRRTLAEARRSVQGLRSIYLEGGDLRGALRDMIAAITSGSALEVKLEVGPEVDALPAKVEDTTLRVAQEALTNVVRHAAATSATVSLLVQGRALLLRVSDNGRGCELEARPGRSHGLVGMRERVEALGGTLEVSGRPLEGTTVAMVLPLSWSAARSAAAAGARARRWASS